MATNMEDERLQAVQTEKQNAIAQVDQTYQDMIDGVDTVYKQQMDAAQQQGEELQKQQQAQTDFAIEQIEQQKRDTQEDYQEEQSAAYVDYKKQTAQHGAAAEQIAEMGMAGTGYSESSKVALYNTYQNRVATARKSLQDAIVSYNNAITEARLQNDATLAQIALETLQQQAALALEGFQYKNQLVLEQTAQKMAVEEEFYGRYLDVLDQINAEAALAEEKRQFDLQLAEEQRQFDLELENAGAQGSIIPESSLNTLKELYPDGVITSENLWNELVKDYGENALTAAGYSFGGKIEDDLVITNQYSDDWVKVDGVKITWAELSSALETGKIISSTDSKGAITFSYNRSNETVSAKTPLPSSKQSHNMVAFGA